ncbi:MAG TPA: caspase family protein [Fimbriimonadaceae bacterium]|nr:caspase family protein [Fimbriimonadaceae bacterium]
MARRTAKALMAGLALAIAAFAQADQAVVVGVQEYKPLISASTLGGCVNDAKALQAILERNHFRVISLFNEQGTRQGILDAIKSVAGRIKPNERFVFYFAGHGRNNPHEALMPADATSLGNDLTTGELNIAIAAVHAKSRTVILDACFSGGMAAGEMARGIDIGDKYDINSRYWEPEEARSKGFEFGVHNNKANNQDSTTQYDAGTGICYYTACSASEPALEGNFGGERHGLFTYALINSFKDDSQSWLDIHNEVKDKIHAKLQNTSREQNPMISQSFINSHALDNDKPVPPKPTKDLMDVWNESHVDPAKLSLQFQPNDVNYEAGRFLALKIETGAEGYLVILSETNGKITKFYPRPGMTADQYHVAPGGSVDWPPRGSNLYFDEFGACQIKAYLFPTAERAQQVIDAVARGGTGAESLVIPRNNGVPDYTSAVTVAISDCLVGGLRPKLPELLKHIATGDRPVDQYIWGRLTHMMDFEADHGQTKYRDWFSNTDMNAPLTVQTKEYALAHLNALIQERSLYNETAFTGVNLSPETKALLAKNPTGREELMKLNRLLLADAYPDEVHRDGADK